METATQLTVDTTLSDLFFNSSEAEKWDGSFEDDSNISECIVAFFDQYPNLKNNVTVENMVHDFYSRV